MSMDTMKKIMEKGVNNMPCGLLAWLFLRM